MRKIEFFKYQGAGNDFVLLDNRKNTYSFLSEEDITLICHRRFGIGADGLMLLSFGERLQMKYFNADGKEGSMCGNGGRCFAKFAQFLGYGTNLEFGAIDGLHTAKILDGESVVLKMSDISKFEKRSTLPSGISVEGFIGNCYVLDSGSPHFVCFVEDLEKIDIEKIGRIIRYHKDFPLGLNVNFVKVELTTAAASGASSSVGSVAATAVNSAVLGSDHATHKLKIRTYERGVEAETYACGTGSTASAIAYYLEYLASAAEISGSENINSASVPYPSANKNTVKLQALGGNLEVNFLASTSLKPTEKSLSLANTSPDLNEPRFTDIYLKGGAKEVFRGEIEI